MFGAFSEFAVLSYGPWWWVLCGNPRVKACAAGATAAVRLATAKAARIMVFIRILHHMPGAMSGWCDGKMREPD